MTGSLDQWARQGLGSKVSSTYPDIVVFKIQPFGHVEDDNFGIDYPIRRRQLGAGIG
jgi:hypothetical protein